MSHRDFPCWTSAATLSFFLEQLITVITICWLKVFFYTVSWEILASVIFSHVHLLMMFMKKYLVLHTYKPFYLLTHTEKVSTANFLDQKHFHCLFFCIKKVFAPVVGCCWWGGGDFVVDSSIGRVPASKAILKFKIVCGTEFFESHPSTHASNKTLPGTISLPACTLRV